MYQIAYIGRWETLPETAVAIYEHDIPKLEALLQGGLDLGAPIQLSEYIKLMPLEIAVFRNDVPMIHFLLEHGADPGRAEEQPLLLTAARCCGPEVVALFAEQTAILSPKQKERAIQEVRWGKRPERLIEQGADITIADKYGDRPYTVAVQNKNQELADYLKALEPAEWHNEQEKLRQLMPYKLPAKVQMDNYSDYLLLWSPRDKKLWYLDIEHEEFHPLAKWDDFIADPGRYLNGMIEGEFEE